jgi:DNA-binding transcriptional LysR family regulator
MTISEYFGRDIRLRHLRLLVAIDDAGQLARVARLLHVTQPAVSKALAEIERSIGEPLFERTRQGLVATRSGAALIRGARTALAELERVGAEMRGLGGGRRQTLIVGAMPTACLPCLGPAIALLGRRDPSLTVRVVDGQTAGLLAQLVAGRVQLVVGGQLRAAAPDGVQSIGLYDDPMELVASPRHPVVRSARPSWERCVAQPWILPPIGHPLRSAFDRALRVNGLRGPEHVVEGLAIDLVLAMIEDAAAINLTTRRLASALGARGLVKVVRGDHAARLGITMPFTVYVNAEQRNERGTRAMIDCLQETAVSWSASGSGPSAPRRAAAAA